MSLTDSSYEYIPEDFASADWSYVNYYNEDLNENVEYVYKLVNQANDEGYVIKTDKQHIFIEVVDETLAMVNLFNGANSFYNFVYDAELGHQRINIPISTPSVGTEGCQDGCTTSFVLTQVGLTAAFLAACASDGPLPFADALAVTAFIAASARNGADYDKCIQDCNKK